MLLVVKENETFYPGNIRLLRAIAVMLEPEFIPHLVQKPGLVRHICGSNKVCYDESSFGVIL
jgi:hypothetical protein